MAQNIGSLEVDISVNSNTQQGAEQAKKDLKEVEEAAQALSDAIDETAKATEEAADTIGKATGEAATEMDNLTAAAETAVTATEQITNTIEETATATDAAAEATAALAEETSATASAVEELNEQTDESAEATAEWADNLYALTVQMLEMAKNGEEQSEQYAEIKTKVEELLSAHQDLAANPPFTAEQTESLRAYKEELQQLADNAEDTASAEDAIAEAIIDAAEGIGDAEEETKKLTKETQANGKAAKSNGGFWNYLGKLLHIKIPAGATAAKFALEALKTAISAGILTVITLLSDAIMKLVDKLTFSFRMQGELNSKVAESTADAIANLKALQAQWNKLGDDIKGKEKFINDNKESFDRLGVAVNSVNEAERLLVTHTKQFVTAIMARARASAAQGMIIKATQDHIEDLAEAEGEIQKIQNEHDEAQQRHDALMQQATNAGAKPQWQGTRQGYGMLGKASKLAAPLTGARRDMESADIKMREAVAKRDNILKEIDNQSASFQRIIVQSNEDAENAMRAGAFDQTTDLKNYKSYLSEKKSAYKDYAQNLNSTNAEVRANAAEIAKVTIAEGKTYYQWLLTEKKRLEKAIADPNDPELDFNKNKYNLLMKEISAESQNDKKKKEELNYYEQLKAALQDQIKLREQGAADAGTERIIKNLRQQIKLFEERNHLVEPPQTDYSDKIAKYREFAEKLVEIEQNRKEQLAKINDNDALTDDDKKTQIAAVNEFAGLDQEQLKAEYGIFGDDLAQAIIDGMKSTLEMSADELNMRIIDLRQQLANLSANTTSDNSAQIAILTSQLTAATTAYNKFKKAATDTGNTQKKTNEELRAEAFTRLKKGISDCAQSFKTLGEQIGGAAGESLEFVGNLTENIMATISAIETYAQLTAKTIEGVGTATATAIRTVETASVILAIISAALQIAMAIVNLFKKDEETYAEKKQFYDAYIDTLDTLIERERKLTETLTAQDAVGHFSNIRKYYEDRIKVEREAGKAYLESGASWKSHSVGYELKRDLNQQDWSRIYAALGNQDSAAVRKIENVMNGRRVNDYLAGNVYGILDLSADELKKIQEEAYETFAKLPSEMRDAINAIIEADEALRQLKDDEREQATGTSRESFVDAFKESLLDLDITAEQVGKNIKEYMRKAMIMELYKKDFQQDINDYYTKFGDFFSDGIITDGEQRELDEIQSKLTNGLEEKIKGINDQFKFEEDEDEGGLSGAIKNASQESIDLLAGQTNAVRMNQVEGMALARESLTAVMEINLNVILCAQYLSSINTAVNGTNSDRAQGITDTGRGGSSWSGR